MASPTLKFKRGLYADLPTLAVGEPGFTTDKYQLYVGSPAGNQLIGGGNFWNLEETTTGGGIKLFEATNNGTDFVELQAPASIAGIQTFIVPGTDGSVNQVLKTDGSGNLSFADVNVSAIDIDGATDIGADIVDADLFIVDDGASGTNRKTTASRLRTYVLGGSSGGTFSDITVGSAVTITSSGIDAGTSGIVTAGGGFVGNLTGDVTGNADTATAADTVKTVNTPVVDANHYLTFVDSDNSTSTAETLKTDAGVTYNPSTNIMTVGTVNITTELNVPTVDVGALRASDGTAAMTIADSTGKVTTSTDSEVQGTFTATAAAVFQGNTDIGNQISDTLTVTARVDSDFIPSTDATRDLGSSSLAWEEGHINRLDGISANLSGIATANEFKGTTLTLSGNGSFGGNVEITGNLSVGGSVTNIDVEDLRIVSPVIELGLERVGDGSLQPPSNVTTYNSGVVMYYNHVGINSTNAKIAAMFAKIKQGGDMRIGFATDVTVTTVGAGDSVSSINAMADIEARGLFINDCAGVSQVISCTGSTRNLENITIDAGTFT